MKDLFGNDYNENEFIKCNSQYQKFKYVNNYRVSEREVDKCLVCKHSCHIQGNVKKYYKCRLLGVSSSEATDIRLRNVCDLFDSIGQQ